MMMSYILNKMIVLFDVPATVEYKDGQTVWLEVPNTISKRKI